VKRILTIFGLALAGQAFASDHNNLEHQRPLLIEDAYSIAFGEREFQTGLSLSSFRNARPRYGYRSEFQYGFAKNQDISVAFDTPFGTGQDGYELSYFRNIQREVDDQPAFGIRLGYERQGGQNSIHGALALTKAWHQYDKLHFNLRLDTLQTPGFVFGYSSPLGYPKSFDKTMLAEISYQGGSTSIGIGLRKQLNAQAVLDAGLQLGVAGASQSPIRLVVGYSIGF
jgi:hypothetical protein